MRITIQMTQESDLVWRASALELPEVEAWGKVRSGRRQKVQALALRRLAERPGKAMTSVPFWRISLSICPTSNPWPNAERCRSKQDQRGQSQKDKKTRSIGQGGEKNA